MASTGRHFHKVFVGNLPWTIGHRELRQYFSEFGRVHSATVVFDKKTGCSKGYGFVTVNNNQFFENLDQIPKHILEGNQLNIQRNN